MKTPHTAFGIAIIRAIRAIRGKNLRDMEPPPSPPGGLKAGREGRFLGVSFAFRCRGGGNSDCAITRSPLPRAATTRGRLTKKAEPPPTRDLNRDSGTASANGGWLRRLLSLRHCSSLSNSYRTSAPTLSLAPCRPSKTSRLSSSNFRRPSISLLGRLLRMSVIFRLPITYTPYAAVAGSTSEDSGGNVLNWATSALAFMVSNCGSTSRRTSSVIGPNLCHRE